MKTNRIKSIEGEPIIEVQLQPMAAYVAALKARNDAKLKNDPKAKIDPIPTPIRVPALIDTGFTGGLMISESLVSHWQLKKRGWSEIGIPRDQETRYFPLFAWDVDMAIKFPKCSHEGGNVLIESFASLVEIVNSKNSKMIIGQEILQMAVFVWNGPNHYFSLTFPK